MNEGMLTGLNAYPCFDIQAESIERDVDIELVPSQFIGIVGGYTGTAMRVIKCRSYAITSAVPEVVPWHIQTLNNALSIDDIYEKAGLGWSELSDIFGVSVRSLHFWRQNQKQMSTLNEYILKNLGYLIFKNLEKEKFIIRNFFIAEVLKKQTILKKIKDGDLAVWIQLQEVFAAFEAPVSPNYSVSDEYYMSKMPFLKPSELFGTSNITESKKIKPKARAIKKIKRYRGL